MLIWECGRIVTRTKSNIFKRMTRSTNDRVSSKFNWFNSYFSNNRVDCVRSCFRSKNTTEDKNWVRSSSRCLNSHQLSINHQIITNIDIKVSDILNVNLINSCVCNSISNGGRNSCIGRRHSTTKVFIFNSNITIV